MPQDLCGIEFFLPRYRKELRAEHPHTLPIERYERSVYMQLDRKSLNRLLMLNDRQLQAVIDKLT
ncbi:MAG: hypothetical protein IKM08_03135, partial [Clostridia bacterium]|nr:hypothetical protein [Clostridia bacterium]